MIELSQSILPLRRFLIIFLLLAHSTTGAKGGQTLTLPLRCKNQVANPDENKRSKSD
jgi:hypothetical protein